MNKKLIFVVIGGLLSIAALVSFLYSQQQFEPWNETELELIRSLSINNLDASPASPSNKVANNPLAAKFGHRLFFDTRFSKNAAVSCATCHDPEKHFTDGLAVAVGVATGTRNTMGLVGVAYSPWFFWDGRKDSLWSQALGPLESQVEHAGTRTQFAHLIFSIPDYKTTYEELFGNLPELNDQSRFPPSAGPLGGEDERQAWQAMTQADRQAISRVFANIGKSMASYQRLLKPGLSDFDLYVQSITNQPPEISAFTIEQKKGLRLFIGRAACIDCHNGPLLTNNEFHNTGVIPAKHKAPGFGRISALETLRQDPFNCLGQFNDAGEFGCPELRYARTGDELIGAHRTPSLRNVAQTAPYMHAGQLASLDEVMRHYNTAELALIGHNEAEPLNLTDSEIRQLVAYLQTLNSPIDAENHWLSPPS